MLELPKAEQWLMFVEEAAFGGFPGHPSSLRIQPLDLARLS